MLTAAQIEQALQHIASSMRTPDSQPQVVVYAKEAIEIVRPLVQKLAEDGCRQYNLSMLLGQLEAISLDNTFNQNMQHWRDASRYLQSFMAEAAPPIPNPPMSHAFTDAEVQILCQWAKVIQATAESMSEEEHRLVSKLHRICGHMAKRANQEEVDNLIKTWVELAKEELANGMPIGQAFEQHHEKIIDNATIREYIKYDRPEIAEVKDLFYQMFGRLTWASIVEHLRKGKG